MVDPVAEPDEVRLEIETELDDARISELIDRFSRDIYRAYDPDADFEGQEHRTDFEAAYTALQIVTRHERAESSVTSGRTSIEYEQSLINAVRDRVRRLEPDDELAGGAVIRNTDRHVNRADSEVLE